MKPNEINSNNYQDMWCKYKKGCNARGAATINTPIEQFKCVGRYCPSLVLLEGSNDTQWVGYCGKDHPLCMMGEIIGNIAQGIIEAAAKEKQEIDKQDNSDQY